MIVDSFMLSAVVSELNKEFMGSVVRSVKAVAPFTVSLSLHQRGKGKFWLIMSSHPRYTHIGWQQSETEAKTMEHDETKRFAEVLERQLERAIFTGAEQLDFDRLVVLRFVTITPLGEKKRFSLWCEIMGKHSNLVLVDEEDLTIVDALKRLPSSVNRYREVLPGKPYIRPPSGNRRNPLTTNLDEIKKLAEQINLSEPGDWAKAFFGMSDPLLNLMSSQVNGDLTSPESFWQAVEWLKVTVEQGKFVPTSWRDADGKIVWCYPMPLTSPTHGSGFQYSTSEPHFGPILTAWLSHLAQKETLEQRRQSILGTLKRSLEGIEAQISELEKRLKESEESDRYRKWGELLLTFSHEIEPEANEAVVVDYDTNPPQLLRIPLPEGKTATEAAQLYFTLYRKLKNATETLPSVIEGLKDRANEVKRLIEECKSADEKRLVELATKLPKVLVRASEPSSPSQPERDGDFIRFTVFGDYEVWLGKNAEANLKLLRVARPDDLWFHVKGAPGSHALLRVKKRKEQVPQKAIEEAARLAAYFSKKRTSSWVEVDYTRAKYVRPVKGKKGLVLYTNFKTVSVEPKSPQSET